METEQNYFIIFNTTEGAYLPLNPDDNGLLTYSTQKQARDAFELNYKEHHEQQSATWSTSAAIHWLNLQPFVVALSASLTPMEVLTTLSNSDTPDLKVYSLSSIAVRSIRAARVDLETCRHYEVSQVELINPKWWQEQPV
ncbi:hypothetical protein ACN23B_30660 (plasmid) [Anabaena sp. FACHB-709]|uniref:Uncharacterized protein n=3 Tax=Nostocaceae TaxID=1162 RepID=A0A1Z4KWV2_ANAVA|nr:MULTISPECIES: hypothetical protein [Nostocaceae]BAY73454.1 hypothetical protein NIES23_63060 [Trichormus variabilis NIES-23]MBD2174620.1 hypothetical protein [Anabaena cylindrica FACHB-318]MBD2254260.1 hypothetical protein [Nostoc parmelioides FACHB-3921]MBD2266329.1 hypothetical protein [Anabaena sp. FACHB-709]MBD2275793.1 hypothetical protein [Nostoc sp. PCC 7120 = FACHB-418]